MFFTKLRNHNLSFCRNFLIFYFIFFFLYFHAIYTCLFKCTNLRRCVRLEILPSKGTTMLFFSLRPHYYQKLATTCINCQPCWRPKVQTLQGRNGPFKVRYFYFAYLDLCFVMISKSLEPSFPSVKIIFHHTLHLYRTLILKCLFCATCSIRWINWNKKLKTKIFFLV